jgi:hypothetical protein
LNEVIARSPFVRASGPWLGARFLASGYYTHGGLVFRQKSDYFPNGEQDRTIFLHHDQIGHDSGLSLGGGLSYALTGSVDLYATYARQVLGHGGHGSNSNHRSSHFPLGPKQTIARSRG